MNANQFQQRPPDPNELRRWAASSDEYTRVLASLHLYHPRPIVYSAIWRAYHDPAWNWKASDGCTVVSELFPRPMRFPPCIAHDHLCLAAERAYRAGRASWTDRNRLRAQADNILRLGHQDYGHPVRGLIRWMAVRAYWWSVGAWKHLRVTT